MFVTTWYGALVVASRAARRSAYNDYDALTGRSVLQKEKKRRSMEPGRGIIEQSTSALVRQSIQPNSEDQAEDAAQAALLSLWCCIHLSSGL